MATFNLDGYTTMVDLAKELDPDGNVAMAVNLIEQYNPFVEDMAFQEGNLPTGNVTTQITKYPSGTWRKLYKGATPSKHEQRQVTDTVGTLSGFATADLKEAQLSGNVAAFRAKQDRMFLKGLSNQMEEAIIYGDGGSRFPGLAYRMNDPVNGENKDYILNGGGASTDNTSIYLVGWGPDSTYGIYPKGSTAGFQMKDYGERLVSDGNGGEFPAYQTWYEWDAGLVIENYKYVVRISNISKAALSPDATTGANLINLLIEASERMEDLVSVRPTFYMNKTLRTVLRNQIREHKNVNLTYDTVEGKRVLAFDEIPVRRADTLMFAESALTFA